jgi:glycosyltransferase involved in cell wall biosynthesis
MRIAMVLSNPCSPDPRVEKEAAALSTAGHEVIVVAWDRAGGLPEAEKKDGFSVVRTGPRARYGGGLSSIGRFRRFWRVATERVVAMSPDAVHCHDTDTFVVGLRALRLLPGARLVLDLHEMYRLSPMVPQRGLARLPARLAVDRLESAAIRRSSAVIVAPPGIVPYYAPQVPAERLSVVMNVPEAGLFTPGDHPADVDPFTVCFVGRLRYPRTLVALMDAAALVPGTRIVIGGDGPCEQEVRDAARGREAVEVLGRVPYGEIPGLYAQSHAVFAGYDAAVGNAAIGTPGKLLEAMACARPAIVSAGTWAGRFVEQERVGLAVDCADPEAIAAALRRLRDQPDEARAMGERGRALIEREYNWEAASAVLAGVYENIAPGRTQDEGQS